MANNEDVKNALAWLKETDTGFYRVEKTYLEGIASMTSLAQDYSSISTYNSMQNGNVKNFVFSSAPDLLFDGLNYYCYSEHPGDGRLPAFLGVRYLLSKEGDPVPDTYVFVRSFGTISVIGLLPLPSKAPRPPGVRPSPASFRTDASASPGGRRR